MSYFITNITSSPATTGTWGSDGYPQGIDNDHGNIRAGGTISETGSFSSNSLGEGNPVTTIVSGVNNFGVVTGATWNFNGGSGVIVRATESLAGVANTAALAGASDSASNANTPLQASNLRVRLYKTAVKAGNWNEYSGTWSSDPSVVESGGYDIANSIDNASTLKASGVDHAANPSSTEPGELQYDLGGLPVQTGYKPKYLW
jgi:hypothetical protein